MLGRARSGLPVAQRARALSARFASAVSAPPAARPPLTNNSTPGARRRIPGPAGPGPRARSRSKPLPSAWCPNLSRSCHAS
jgi:hypothetical protein